MEERCGRSRDSTTIRQRMCLFRELAEGSRCAHHYFCDPKPAFLESFRRVSVALVGLDGLTKKWSFKERSVLSATKSLRAHPQYIEAWRLEETVLSPRQTPWCRR
jgi:hypothetical protein